MAGTFEIPRDGRLVAARLFESEREIMDFIGQQEPGDYPGLTHHNSESGLAGKPCLLVKSKLLDHIFATFR